MTKPRDKHSWINRDTDALLKVILMLKDLDEARCFLRDLLTEKEITELGQRWRVARMLAQGERYSTIEKKTKMSSTTIARIHKWLKKGMGGYQLILERLKENR